MIQKNLVLLISSIFLFTGCSTLGLLGPKKIETVSKPIQIDIMQPDLPRPVELTAPKWSATILFTDIIRPLSYILNLAYL